ncbi:hypothetical protein BZA77DRAFT_306419 [Pyronema omphalodes]|nr:hypothetical protein BZA77DRAFT_306419 [Pyronema omphalodes]
MPPKESDAMSYATSETDFYELLGVSNDVVSDGSLRKAFRKESLKWHPDKNPSPEAAEKFHLLTIAYEVLSDPATRTAYDNARAARLAKKRRSEAFDMHRRQMQQDLEGRENMAKRQKTEQEEEELKFQEQLAKLQKEGAEMRRRAEEAIRQAAKEEEALAEKEKVNVKEKKQESQFTEMDRTVKVRWKKSSAEGKTLDENSLRKMFAKYGRVQDCVSIPTGADKKFQSGLLIFESIVGAHTAVHTFTDGKDDLAKIFKSVSWAGGKEPDLGEGFVAAKSSTPPPSHTQETSPPPKKPAAWKPGVSTSKDGAKRTAPSFGSFSSVKTNTQFSKSAAAEGSDYESLTLMRMREAEKRRLEAELRKKESEAQDDNE